MSGNSGAVRGFFIALAVSIGIPAAMLPLAITVPAFAMAYAYSIAPQLVFAYPAFVFSATRHQAPLLSLVQMTVLSSVFGLLTRNRSGGSQFLRASLVSVAWWAAWRVIGLAFGLQPEFDVRM